MVPEQEKNCSEHRAWGAVSVTVLPEADEGGEIHPPILYSPCWALDKRLIPLISSCCFFHISTFWKSGYALQREVACPDSTGVSWPS